MREHNTDTLKKEGGELCSCFYLERFQVRSRIIENIIFKEDEFWVINFFGKFDLFFFYLVDLYIKILLFRFVFQLQKLCFWNYRDKQCVSQILNRGFRRIDLVNGNNKESSCKMCFFCRNPRVAIWSTKLLQILHSFNINFTRSKTWKTVPF